MHENNELLTTAETAARLRVCRETVLRLARSGALTPLRYSKRTFRFPVAEVNRFLETGIRA